MSNFRMPTFRESIAPASYKMLKDINKVPTPPNAPPPPVIEDTEGRQQDEADRLRRRRGRAAADMTRGNAGVPMTAAKALLGG